MRLISGQAFRFAIDFRNWKYMSEFKRFDHSTSDVEILTGIKEGSQIVNFAAIPKDADSRYEVGGRIFFEATVFGQGIISFTTNGFFEKEGYKEPMQKSIKQTGVVIGVTMGILAIIFAVAYFIKRK